MLLARILMSFTVKSSILQTSQPLLKAAGLGPELGTFEWRNVIMRRKRVIIRLARFVFPSDDRNGSQVLPGACQIRLRSVMCLTYSSTEHAFMHVLSLYQTFHLF
jgi:hypothetical protein